MKTSTLLLVVSLAANAVLVAVAMRPSSPAKSAGATSPVVAGSPAHAAVAPGATASTANVPVANLWSRLHAGSYDQFRDRLLAAGFPAKVVRAMLAMAIGDEGRERREAIVGKIEDTPYWKIPSRYMVPKFEHQAQLAEIDRETSELFNKYANGPETLAESEDEINAAKRRFGNLPLEKLQQLTALERKMQQLQMEAYAKNLGAGRIPDEGAMRAQREAQEALERTRVAELAKVLDPAELEQYELRNSPASGGLRMQLSAFSPTEAEFKALYALQKSGAITGDRDQYMAQLQAALGPDRYADYEAVTMSGSDHLPKLIARLELPLSTIKTINTVRDDIRQRTQVINDNTQLTADQRASQLAGLEQEANERLTSTLGKRGYEAYADLKGEWIRALKPKKK